MLVKKYKNKEVILFIKIKEDNEWKIKTKKGFLIYSQSKNIPFPSLFMSEKLSAVFHSQAESQLIYFLSSQVASHPNSDLIRLQAIITCSVLLLLLVAS